MTATISVQLYSVRESLEIDVAHTLGRIADLGFTAVELYGLSRFGDSFASALASIGLTASGTHAKLIGADPEAALDAAAGLGVTTVIEPSTPAASWTSRDEIARMADELNAAAELAGRRGIRVGYHNHDGEIRARVDGAPALEHFVALLDPRVVLEIDAYWVAAGGEDAVRLVRRLADRVRLVHVKDGSLEGDLASQAAAGTGIPPAHLAGQLPPGAGVVPLSEVLDTADGSLEFAVVEFDVYGGDVFAGLADGREFLLRRGYAG